MTTAHIVFPLPRVTLESGPTWQKNEASGAHVGGRVDVPVVTFGALSDGGDVFALQVGPQLRFGHQLHDQSYVGGGIVARGAVGALGFHVADALVVPVVSANVGATNRGVYLGGGGSASIIVDQAKVGFGPTLNYNVDYSLKGEASSKSLSAGFQVGFLL